MSDPSAIAAEQAQAELQALLNGPAAKPPPGVLPNFNDPANLNAFVILTVTLCVTFGTFSVAIRMYTKKFIIRSFEREDCKFTLIDSNDVVS